MTHDELWRAIVKLAASKNMSCSGLAKFAGRVGHLHTALPKY